MGWVRFLTSRGATVQQSALLGYLRPAAPAAGVQHEPSTSRVLLSESRYNS